MDWQVTLSATLSTSVDPSTLAVMNEALEKFDATLAGGSEHAPNGVEATMTIYNTGWPQEAITAATEAFESELRDRLGQSVLGWTSVQAITTEEDDRRLNEPTIPELVSGVEAAAILGVSRQRVHQLAAENAQFPPPVARLASGSIWLRTSVEGFTARWERKPGRPAKVG